MTSAITRDLPVLRSYDDVRTQIDAALGDGQGMTPKDAWSRLSNLGRAVWMLDELRWLMSGRIHVFSQQYLTSESFDGAPLLARLAGAIRPLDDEVADFCQWVAERGARDRRDDLNESFVSVVNFVGDILAEPFDRLAVEVAERWPEELAPESLPEPPPWRARALAPAASAPRFPSVVIDWPASTSHGPSYLTSVALTAMWRAGVDDDALETARAELTSARERLPEVLSEWVPFEGDLEGVRARLFPPHPLERLLGQKLEHHHGIVRIDPPRFADIASELQDVGYEVCLPDEEGTAAQHMRAAVRFDPDGLIVRAEDLTTVEDAAFAVQAAQVGMVVIVSGETPIFEEALGKVPPKSVRVFDRRRSVN